METSLLLSDGDLKISCKLSEPDSGSICRVVLGVHGLGGSADDRIQQGIAEEMALFRSATIRFDFPGHGDSPLDSEDFTVKNCRATVMAAARYAKERYPQIQDLCIFATGFGAYVTLICLPELLELPGRVRLVVQTPALRMHDTLLSMANVSKATFWAMDHITFPTPRPLTFRYRFYEELLENIALGTCPIPVLILHGQEDAYIPMSDILHFRRINEDAKLVIIPGTTHRFLEEGAWDMVLDLTRDWFAFEQVLVTEWI